MSDKEFKFPKPEEVQKEFEDFIKNRFGQGVQIFTSKMHEGEKKSEPKPADASEFQLDFNYKPREIKEYLDRYVIRQEEAKKALAIAVCDHYNHARLNLEIQRQQRAPYDYAKQNVLVLGPTGVGKTYLIRKIAELVGVPFVKADATRFSETGYVGANVDDLVRDLVHQADGDLEAAQFGIVYLDEADKLAAGTRMGGGRDVSGRGVQFGLLKLMEETEVDLRSGNDIQSQMQAFMDMQRGKTSASKVNTRNILFIVSGAFSGLEEIISKRLNQNAIGFTRKEEKLDKQNILSQASTQDFIDFGFEPEFIGRLPVRVACQHLDEDDLYHVLKDSEGSIIRQYELSFAAYGIDLSFQDDALKAIAEQASHQKTGARSLMTVCENLLRDFKFELPSTGIDRLEVTRQMVEQPRAYLRELLSSSQAQISRPIKQAADTFSQDFKEKFEVELTFTEDFLRRLQEQTSDYETALKLLTKRLESYQHGLKLIQQKTAKTHFLLPEEAFIEPQRHLERLFYDNYEKVGPSNHQES